MYTLFLSPSAPALVNHPRHIKNTLKNTQTAHPIPNTPFPFHSLPDHLTSIQPKTTLPKRTYWKRKKVRKGISLQYYQRSTCAPCAPCAPAFSHCQLHQTSFDSSCAMLKSLSFRGPCAKRCRTEPSRHQTSQTAEFHPYHQMPRPARRAHLAPPAPSPHTPPALPDAS